MDTYYDTSNDPFGTGSQLASGLTDNQVFTTVVPPIAGPYLLTEILTVTAGANSLTSLDGAVFDAPEPGSGWLFGAGLIALGVFVGRHAVVARSLPPPHRQSTRCGLDPDSGGNAVVACSLPASSRSQSRKARTLGRSSAPGAVTI